LEEIVIDVKVVLKRIIEDFDMKMWAEFNRLETESNGKICEHDNELLGSVKAENFMIS